MNNVEVLRESVDIDTLLSKYHYEELGQNGFRVRIPMALSHLVYQDEDTIFDQVNDAIIDGYLLCGISMTPVGVENDYIIIEVTGEVDYDPED